MKTVMMLEPYDTIRMDDWCRPLELQSMSGGTGDSYAFTSCYSGTPDNNSLWARADTVFGDIWEGERLAVVNKTLRRDYEFVRGDIPLKHRLTGFEKVPSVKVRA